MKKLVLMFILLPGCCFSQEMMTNSNYRNMYLSTGVTMQNWQIEGVSSRISEAAFPFFLNVPVFRNGNLQISHTPAISHYADIELSGFSDTWILGNYQLLSNKLLISAGIGVPTGKTELTEEESVLSGILSQNILRFRLPVFGQGLTVSTGLVYAVPFSKKIVFGIGGNYIHRNTYKFLKDMDTEFDPGDQIGANLGYSHELTDHIRLSLDFIYTYYLRDQINNKEIYGAGQKFGSRVGFLYRGIRRLFYMEGRFRTSGRNETWNGITLITEEKNSNITQLEMDAIYRIHISEIYSIDVLFEGRSYLENEYLLGKADIVGGGMGNTVKLYSDFQLYLAFKVLYGDAFYNRDYQTFNGSEFIIRTTYLF